MGTSLGGFERNYYGVKQPQGFPGIPEGWVTEWETRVAADGVTKLFSLIHPAGRKERSSEC